MVLTTSSVAQDTAGNAPHADTVAEKDVIDILLGVLKKDASKRGPAGQKHSGKIAPVGIPCNRIFVANGFVLQRNG